MAPLIATAVTLLVFLLIGEWILWKLLVRRLDPKDDLVDEDIARAGLFTMKRIRIVAMCHTILLGIALIAPLIFLW